MMYQDIKELVELLPYDGLTMQEYEKIKEVFPVPKEHTILWASIDSLGGYPSGCIITDRAFIYKASRRAVKSVNTKIKAHNKGEKRKNKKPRLSYIYNVIPWEYYSP